MSDISALASLTNLTHLDLGGTQVSDVSALAKLTNLTTLNLSSTQISDEKALHSLGKLIALNLSQTQLSKEKIITLQENLPKCNIEHDCLTQTATIKPGDGISINEQGIWVADKETISIFFDAKSPQMQRATITIGTDTENCKFASPLERVDSAHGEIKIDTSGCLEQGTTQMVLWTKSALCGPQRYDSTEVTLQSNTSNEIAAFVSDFDGSKVYAVAANGNTLNSYDVGRGVEGFAFDGRYLLAPSDLDSSSVTIIDTQTGTTSQATLPCPEPDIATETVEGFVALACAPKSPNDPLTLLSLPFSEGILASQVSSLAIDTYSNSSFDHMIFEGGKLFAVSNKRVYSFFVAADGQLTLAGTSAEFVDGSLHQVTLDVASKRLFVTDSYKQIIRILGADTLSELATWSPWNGLEPYAHGVDFTAAGELFVTNATSHVFKVDPQTGSNLNSLNLGSPYTNAIAEVNGEIWVVIGGSGTIARIRASDLTHLGSIQTNAVSLDAIKVVE